MTEATGSQSQPASKSPWEQTWNDVKEAVTDVGNAVKEAVTPASSNPWDREWSKPVPPEKPRVVPPSRFDQVFDRLIGAESGGVHEKGGKLTTSGKGAEGLTQVMPRTGVDPGYGVKPLKDKSKEEYKRFGRDYLKAMLNEFDDDYEKALAAYNAGVGNVKFAIEKGGKKWKDHLPKKEETLPYIEKILRGK